MCRRVLGADKDWAALGAFNTRGEAKQDSRCDFCKCHSVSPLRGDELSVSPSDRTAAGESSPHLAPGRHWATCVKASDGTEELAGVCYSKGRGRTPSSEERGTTLLRVRTQELREAGVLFLPGAVRTLQLKVPLLWNSWMSLMPAPPPQFPLWLLSVL